MASSLGDKFSSAIKNMISSLFKTFSDKVKLPIDKAISKVEQSLIRQNLLLRNFQETKNNEHGKFRNIFSSLFKDIVYLVSAMRAFLILFNENDVQLGRSLGNFVDMKKPLGYCYVFWLMWTQGATIIFKMLYHIGQYNHSFDIYTDWETWKKPAGLITSKLSLKDIKIIQVLLSAHDKLLNFFFFTAQIIVILPLTIFIWISSDYHSDSVLGQIYELFWCLFWIYWVQFEATKYFTFPYLATISCFHVYRRFQYVNNQISKFKIKSTDKCRLVRDKISRLIHEHDEVCEIVRRYNKSFKYPIAMLSLFFSMIAGTLVPIGLGQGATIPLIDMFFQTYIFTFPFIVLGIVHYSASKCYGDLTALSVRFPAKYDPLFKRKILRKLKEISHHQPVAFYCIDINHYDLHSMFDMLYIPSITYGMLLITNRY